MQAKKKALKKEEILESAINILAEKGYHGTTMEDIASHLLMTKGSLYYYFKDKQELVYESQVKLLNRSIEQMKEIKKMDGLAIDKLKKTVQLHTRFLIQNMAGFELMVKPNEIFTEEQLKVILTLRRKYAEHYDRLLIEGIHDGSMAVDPGEVKLVRNLLLGAMNWITQWYSAQSHLELDHFVKAITEYVLRIVRAHA